MTIVFAVASVSGETRAVIHIPENIAQARIESAVVIANGAVRQSRAAQEKRFFGIVKVDRFFEKRDVDLFLEDDLAGLSVKSNQVLVSTVE